MMRLLMMVVFLISIGGCSKQSDQLSMEDLAGVWDFKGRFVCTDTIVMERIEYDVFATFDSEGLVVCDIPDCGKKNYGTNPAISSVEEWSYEIEDNSIYFKWPEIGNYNFRWDIIVYDEPYLEIEEYYYFGPDSKEETSFTNEFVLKKR